MKSKEKVLFLFGTRPEIIRLSSIIKKCFNFCDVKLLNTSQNFDPNLNKIFLKNFQLKIDFNFDNKSSNFMDFFKNSTQSLADVLKSYKPNKVVILGDTNSALLSFFFKRLNIPIYHIEAGNRSFDDQVPEETNRKIIDHFSDFNFVYSERARLNLISEGLPSNRIFLIGSPLREVYNENKDKILNSNILNKLNVKKGNYFLISFHRYENINNDQRINNLVMLLDKITTIYKKKVILSYHPSLKSKLDLKKIFKNNKSIILFDPFSYFEYCKLQINSFFTLSDSGSISEESMIMKFRAISLRYSIERQEATEAGHTPIAGLDPDKVISLIELNISRKKISLYDYPNEYLIDDSSTRFLNILIGQNYK